MRIDPAIQGLQLLPKRLAFPANQEVPPLCGVVEELDLRLYGWIAWPPEGEFLVEDVFIVGPFKYEHDAQRMIQRLLRQLYNGSLSLDDVPENCVLLPPTMQTILEQIERLAGSVISTEGVIPVLGFPRMKQ